MPHTILSLKLRIPSLRLDFVPRKHLIAQLDEIWQPDKRLILVCAPAGYGKTSLIIDWLSHFQPGVDTSFDSPVIAWLSLDDTDNNLPYYILYLIEALKNGLPPQQYQDFRLACEILESSQSVSAQDILTGILNSLSESPRPILLVLDDYHFIINPVIHDSMKFLLANLPSNVRFLLATRVDPPLGLAQLRARNQMVEIRSAGLQFTLPETTEFLNHTMGLPLTAEQMSVLANRTEGWVVGLQMAALSLRGCNDPDAFIRAFGGSHRFILEYLLEEVLNCQPPAVQEFLLRTSIFERLCPQACDYLLEQPNTSQLMLETLERTNLFLVSLDEEKRWYRYHNLFTNLLRSRLRQSLDPAAMQDLYCRSSQWFQSQGLLAEAITQALAAPDFTFAADLLEREILTFFYQSEITQVHRWLELLPETLILQRSLLCAVYAASIALLPPYPPKSLMAAEKWMQTAERRLSKGSNFGDLTRAFIYTIRSYWARFRNEPPELVLQLIANALSELSEDTSALTDRNKLFVRSALQMNLGLVYWNTGDEQAARQAFVQARSIGLTCGDLFNAASSINYLVKIHFYHGQTEDASALCREALAFFNSQQAHLGHRVPYSGEIGVQLAEILIEQNELAEAEQLLKENIDLAKWTMSHYILLKGYLSFARLAVAQGNEGLAFEYLDDTEKISKEGAEQAEAQRACLWRSLGGKNPDFLELARNWAENRALVEFGQAPQQIEWTISLALARIILMEENTLQAGTTKARPPRLERLLEWLERQEHAMQVRGWAHWEIQLRLIECLTRHRLGDQTGSRAALRHALELAAPGGYVRIFIEEGEPLRRLLVELENDAAGLTSYLRKLLANFPDGSGRPVQRTGSQEGLVEPLTEREMDVLHFISQGLSNQEIAEKLVVTINTVKKHNYSIFSKLGVSNRAQAIVRARILGLSN